MVVLWPKVTSQLVMSDLIWSKTKIVTFVMTLGSVDAVMTMKVVVVLLVEIVVAVGIVVETAVTRVVVLTMMMKAVEKQVLIVEEPQRSHVDLIQVVIPVLMAAIEELFGLMIIETEHAMPPIVRSTMVMDS